MYLDQTVVLSDSQVITGSAASTNVLDLGAPGKTAYNSNQLKRNIGKGDHIPLLIQVTEDFATLTSLTIAFQSDDDSAFGTPKTLFSIVVPVAELKKGYICPMDKFPRGITERYIRLNYTVTGSNATTGKIFAGVVAAVDGSYQG